MACQPFESGTTTDLKRIKMDFQFIELSRMTVLLGTGLAECSGKNFLNDTPWNTLCKCFQVIQLLTKLCNNDTNPPQSKTPMHNPHQDE
jgi:hypothetical protein